MVTWTNIIKNIQKRIIQKNKITDWKITYLSTYRLIDFSSDDFYCFRGIVSKCGKFIYVMYLMGSVQNPGFYYDDSVGFNDKQCLKPGHQLTLQQFNQYIDIKMKQYI